MGGVNRRANPSQLSHKQKNWDEDRARRIVTTAFSRL
jgi:hypothetical protein